MPRPRKTPPPDDETLTDLITPALPDAVITGLARLAEASPEEFAEATAGAFQHLIIEGFRTIQAPRNIKEMKDMVGLWRQAKGLDKDKGGALPVGLVGVLRAVQRRAVVVDCEDGDDGECEEFE